MVSAGTKEANAVLVSEVERLRSVCAGLEAERRLLTDALARHVEENAALRSSALLWLDLYERQLRRANALASRF